MPVRCAACAKSATFEESEQTMGTSPEGWKSTVEREDKEFRMRWYCAACWKLRASMRPKA